jgi:hypothetical protein
MMKKLLLAAAMLAELTALTAYAKEPVTLRCSFVPTEMKDRVSPETDVLQIDGDGTWRYLSNDGTVSQPELMGPFPMVTTNESYTLTVPKHGGNYEFSGTIGIDRLTGEATKDSLLRTDNLQRTAKEITQYVSTGKCVVLTDLTPKF